jgi:aryl-alcohol dehydrogenase-like predicted oxidoreductase
VGHCRYLEQQDLPRARGGGLTGYHGKHDPVPKGTDMEYTRLGSTGLKVSRVTLGCMSFGDTSRGFNEWALDDEQAEPIFRQAVELGITFWDTTWVLPHDDKPIADAVLQIAADRGVPMAQVALAWVLKNPVVTAPIVGPTKPGHLADAAAALEIRLTDDEVRRLEAPYTPRTPTGFQLRGRLVDTRH